MFFAEENEEERLFQELLSLVQDSKISESHKLPDIVEQLTLLLKEYQKIPMNKVKHQITLNSLARWASGNPQTEIVKVLEEFGADYKNANTLPGNSK